MTNPHHKPAKNSTQDATIDITRCIAASGGNPDVPFLKPGNPDKGPAYSPVKLSDLVWVATDLQGRDISSSFDFGKPMLSWSIVYEGHLYSGKRTGQVAKHNGP